jgi:multiple sugar transport system permease protein|tara:strand:+ start:769 stop:1593 length:825 start_codon:yes stop_codon:yes gene_type:complete
MKTMRPPRWGILLLLATAILFSIPMIWLVLSSLKPAEQLTEDPYSLLPASWQWNNFSDALDSMPYLVYLTNSLLLCAGTVVGSVLSCSLVAYGFARLRWRGRRLLFGILVATMLLPWHVTMIPRFLLFRELGWYNHLTALIAPTFLGDAFFIFLLRQFFLSIPEELSEAARLDGLGEWGIFWKIILPLSKPALATVALFQFIATWNDFGGPLLYLNDPSRFPLAYGLEQFVSSYSDQTHLLMAAAVLFTLPVIVLFLFTQRTFLRGISTAGLKQ